MGGIIWVIALIYGKQISASESALVSKVDWISKEARMDRNGRRSFLCAYLTIDVMLNEIKYIVEHPLLGQILRSSIPKKVMVGTRNSSRLRSSIFIETESPAIVSLHPADNKCGAAHGRLSALPRAGHRSRSHPG